MRRIFQIIIIVLILVGCASKTSKKSVPIITLSPNKPVQRIKKPISPVSKSKILKVTKVNWLKEVIDLVNQLVHAPGIELGKVLLINIIENNTNMSIQYIQATEVIFNIINNQHVFKLVPKHLVVYARKAMGLSQTDSLVTRSKAIGLARYVQADYVLYSVLSGHLQQGEIAMQLMEVKTGEILWSGVKPSSFPSAMHEIHKIY